MPNEWWIFHKRSLPQKPKKKINTSGELMMPTEYAFPFSVITQNLAALQLFFGATVH